MCSPLLPFPHLAGVARAPSSSSDLSPGARRQGVPKKGRLTWFSREAEQHQEYASAAANSCRKPQKCTLYRFIISSLLIIS